MLPITAISPEPDAADHEARPTPVLPDDGAALKTGALTAWRVPGRQGRYFQGCIFGP